jgi:uncharacterized membrane protein
MEWVELAARWLHVITAIAWNGSSFYFIALDLGLRPVSDPGAGIHGEGRQEQGGGFYHIQKYFIALAWLPEDVTWFKWECYATWLTGFVMVVLLYYLGVELFLIGPSILDIPARAGVVIPIGSLVFGWIVYDLICNSRFGNDNTRLMFGLYVILVVMAGGYSQVHRAGDIVASGCIYRDHHVGQCVYGHHSQPENRGCRSGCGENSGPKNMARSPSNARPITLT